MTETEYDFFISYSRHDLKIVMQIKSIIEKNTDGKCWMDLNAIESGSQRFTKDIVDGIINCQAFLFMLSKNSQVSEYALNELNFAKEKGKRIVIIHIDKCQMNDEFLLIYGLRDRINWDDFPQRDKLLKDLKRWKLPKNDNIEKLIDDIVGAKDFSEDEFRKFLEKTLSIKVVSEYISALNNHVTKYITDADSIFSYTTTKEVEAFITELKVSEDFKIENKRGHGRMNAVLQKYLQFVQEKEKEKENREKHEQ